MTTEYLEYYRREIEWFRSEAKGFAADHSAEASRLDLGEGESRDPHTERLIEAFSFLTARIQKKLDDDFPELTDALLGSLYPSLVRPIPSMALVEVAPDFEQAIPTSGLRLPRGSSFVSKPVRGLPLRFRSTSAATIWPVAVSDVALESPDHGQHERFPSARRVLRIGLEAVGEFSFGEMEIDRLRFYLHGERRVAHALYEALTLGARAYEIRLNDGERIDLPASLIASAGFGDDDAMLPYPRRSFAGYRILQEYFAFPDKFMFFDFGGFDRLRDSKARGIELVVVLDREVAVDHASLSKDNLRLGCVPLVNLFEKVAEPIPASPFVAQQRVTPDASRPTAMEIYSIESVVGVSPKSGERTRFAPFYSPRNDGGDADDRRAFWHASRRSSARKGDAGRDVSIALVDLDMNPSDLAGRVVLVTTLCTNRDLPHSVGEWGGGDDFSIEGVTGIRGVSCLHKPTPCRRAGLGKGGTWRLVSQLSLNYLSLVREGRGALQQILHRYDFTGIPANRDQVMEGIRDLRSRTVWKRIAGGFCSGTETTVRLDRDKFVGGGVALFAAVLERFLGLYCAVNSFSQLVLETEQEKGEIYTWKPRAGEQSIL